MTEGIKPKLHMRRYWRSGLPLWLLSVAGVVFLALLVALIVALAADTDPAVPDVGLTVADIAHQPEFYVGQLVTVSGEVDRVVDDRSFILGSHRYLGGSLLVLSQEDIPAVVTEEARPYPIGARQVVQVTGVVRILDRPAVTDEVGWDLDEERFGGFEGDPVIVASIIALTPLLDEPPPED